jgi:2-polyprenyl-3-methyl-5-hydroxy-6-metoxy-1,4-benzoquinol methylase
MTVGEADEFDAGERVYLGKTTMEGVVREHIIRYEFAVERLGKSGTVVDAACGSGYGSQMLARHARQVVGFDISASAIAYASEHHRDSRVSYVRADLDRGLPVRSGTVDDIVSFETLEHVSSPQRLVSEYSRGLHKGGHLILSTPDRMVYSDLSGYTNPFHRAELNRRELIEVLSAHFEIEAVYGQVRWTGSVLRSQLKQAVKRKLPPGTLAVAKAANASRRWLVSRTHPVADDLSLHPIEHRDAELYFFLVLVARKP